MHIDKRGVFLVFGSALAWSLGGAIARYLHLPDTWSVVFWRSVFASVFLLGYMLHQHGVRGTWKLFTAMGLPGVGVAICFATASACFVVALSYTTVANVLLMQAGVPLIAALLGYLVLKEEVSVPTWCAIAGVIGGVTIMVSGSVGGSVSPVGDGLALLIAVVFACATVITRHHSHVAMMPAVCLGMMMAAAVSGILARSFSVSASELALLVVFGAVNLGLGMALFAAGAGRIPSALAALIGMAEPVLGPVWVWLVHGETPGQRTLLGGLVVFLSLLAHVGWQFRAQLASRPLAD